MRPAQAACASVTYATLAAAQRLASGDFASYAPASRLATLPEPQPLAGPMLGAPPPAAAPVAGGAAPAGPLEAPAAPRSAPSLASPGRGDPARAPEGQFAPPVAALRPLPAMGVPPPAEHKDLQTIVADERARMERGESTSGALRERPAQQEPEQDDPDEQHLGRWPGGTRPRTRRSRRQTDRCRADSPGPAGCRNPEGHGAARASGFAGSPLRRDPAVYDGLPSAACRQ